MVGKAGPGDQNENQYRNTKGEHGVEHADAELEETQDYVEAMDGDSEVDDNAYLEEDSLADTGYQELMQRSGRHAYGAIKSDLDDIYRDSRGLNAECVPDGVDTPSRSIQRAERGMEKDLDLYYRSVQSSTKQYQQHPGSPKHFQSPRQHCQGPPQGLKDENQDSIHPRQPYQTAAEHPQTLDLERVGSESSLDRTADLSETSVGGAFGYNGQGYNHPPPGANFEVDCSNQYEYDSVSHPTSMPFTPRPEVQVAYKVADDVDHTAKVSIRDNIRTESASWPTANDYQDLMNLLKEYRVQLRRLFRKYMKSKDERGNEMMRKEEFLRLCSDYDICPPPDDLNDSKAETTEMMHDSEDTAEKTRLPPQPYGVTRKGAKDIFVSVCFTYEEEDGVSFSEFVESVVRSM